MIKTEKIEILFNNNSDEIEKIFILPDRTKVCAGGKMSMLIRTPDAVSDPAILINSELIEDKENLRKIKFSDESGDYTALLTIKTNGERTEFAIEAEAPKPVWLVEWKLQGLDFNEVLVPALGGQSISRDMLDGSQLSYKYPFWWNAQFVLGEVNEGSGILLHTEDKEPLLKLLRVGKSNGLFDFTYGYEAEAPLNESSVKFNFFIDSYSGGWKDGVDIHRNWYEKDFELYKTDEHPAKPDWFKDINFILEPWGARKGPKASHTFSQMIDRIEEWKELHDPKKTLLYLPGFAENGVDSHAPDYNPSEQCGGAEEFGKLVKRAHELGYKVMIHTNILAMTFSHREYPNFKKHQVIDAFGRPQTWGIDMDGDWLAEPYFAYINPGYKKWGDLMTGILGDLIKKFDLDAVFVDQTLLAFNVSEGPNFMQGMHDHVRRLQSEFPGVLFAGEGINELVAPTLPVVQIHGIDSIAEVHGMDDRVNWRKVHPVSSYYFSKYSEFTAHLLTKYPDHPMFELQEKSYAELGVIPTLCLYDSEQPVDIPAVREMIKRAENLKKGK